MIFLLKQKTNKFDWLIIIILDCGPLFFTKINFAIIIIIIIIIIICFWSVTGR